MYKLNISALSFCGVTATMLIASPLYAESRIVLLIAGEAYEGAPAFEIQLGDKVIGERQLVHPIDTMNEGRLFFSPDPQDYIERFEFTVADADFTPGAPVRIILTNDRFKEEGWGRDRNLFVRSVEVNGLTVHAADLRLTDGVRMQNVNYQAGLLPIYHQNHMVVAEPPVPGWPLPSAASSADLSAKPEPGGAGG